MRSVLLLTMLLACGGSADESSGGGPSSALVEVATAEDGGLSDTWTVPGDVRALERAELAAGAAGPVTEVSVREGARVEAGDTLLVVDPAPAAARLTAARAAEAEARAELVRATRDRERLSRVSDDVLAASERDAAEAEVARLEARVAGLEAAAREAAVVLARHTLRAPFGGVVTARYVDRGDWVAVAQPVLDLVSVDRVDVRVDATPALARQVAPGDPVQLGTVDGTVAAVVPALDPSTRTSLIRLTPSAPDHGLTPGGTVSVGFQVQRTATGGALVPRDALVLGPVDTKVVRMAEGHADIVTVEVLATSAERALVRGVQPGDVVVTRGGERVRPGQPLRTADEGVPTDEGGS